MNLVFFALVLLVSLTTPLVAQESFCQRRPLTAEDWVALAQTRSQMTRDKFAALSAEHKEGVCRTRMHIAVVRRTGQLDPGIKWRFVPSYLTDAESNLTQPLMLKELERALK